MAAHLDPELPDFAPVAWGRDNGTSKTTTIRMLDDVGAKFDELCKAYDCTRTQLIQALIAREHAEVFKEEN